MNALSPPTVRRNARGRLLPGARLNPGGRPISGVSEIRARYSRRVPEIFDALVEMATDNSQPPMVQLAAIRLALDHLLGKPPVAIDTTVAKVDVTVAELYHSALRRAGLGQTIDGGNSTINGGANAASDLTE
jgi:hypothetical protein